MRVNLNVSLLLVALLAGSSVYATPMDMWKAQACVNPHDNFTLYMPLYLCQPTLHAGYKYLVSNRNTVVMKTYNSTWCDDSGHGDVVETGSDVILDGSCSVEGISSTLESMHSENFTAVLQLYNVDENYCETADVDLSLKEQLDLNQKHGCLKDVHICSGSFLTLLKEDSLCMQSGYGSIKVNGTNVDVFQTKNCSGLYKTTSCFRANENMTIVSGAFESLWNNLSPSTTGHPTVYVTPTISPSQSPTSSPSKSSAPTTNPTTATTAKPTISGANVFHASMIWVLIISFAVAR